MTQQERFNAILDFMEDYTVKHTVSAKAARKALIAEGIYTKRGKLRAKFREQAAEAA